MRVDLLLKVSKSCTYLKITSASSVHPPDDLTRSAKSIPFTLAMAVRSQQGRLYDAEPILYPADRDTCILLPLLPFNEGVVQYVF